VHPAPAHELGKEEEASKRKYQIQYSTCDAIPPSKA
jgi:hypothetical protein